MEAVLSIVLASSVLSALSQISLRGRGRFLAAVSNVSDASDALLHHTVGRVLELEFVCIICICIHFIRS